MNFENIGEKESATIHKMGGEMMAKKKSTLAEVPAKKPNEVLAEKALAIMQKLNKNGIVEFTSRLISDKLGLEPDDGRNKVRILMKKLEAKGKVVVQHKAVNEKGARKKYFYRLKQSK